MLVMVSTGSNVVAKSFRVRGKEPLRNHANFQLKPRWASHIMRHPNPFPIQKSPIHSNPSTRIRETPTHARSYNRECESATKITRAEHSS